MKKEAQTPISNRGFDAQFLCNAPYANELRLPGLVASIDNVRMKFTYHKSSYNHATFERCETLEMLYRNLTSEQLWCEGLFDFTTQESRFRIGNYARTITYKLEGDLTFVVLLGRYCADSSVKQLAPELVLDFNPNKIPGKAWQRIVAIASAYAQSVIIQRFDLAIDFPISRDMLVLQQRPRSVYKKFVSPSGAITECTGERSNHAAIKLYDKGAELEIDVPLTRLEITIDPAKMEKLRSLMPLIHSKAPLELSADFYELPFEVQAVILHPDLYDLLKASTSRNTWTKYKKQITSYGENILVIPDEQLDQIEKYVRSYLARLPSAHLHQGVNI